jgi:hypothetical protein
MRNAGNVSAILAAGNEVVEAAVAVGLGQHTMALRT